MKIFPFPIVRPRIPLPSHVWLTRSLDISKDFALPLITHCSEFAAAWFALDFILSFLPYLPLFPIQIFVPICIVSYN